MGFNGIQLSRRRLYFFENGFCISTSFFSCLFFLIFSLEGNLKIGIGKESERYLGQLAKIALNLAQRVVGAAVCLYHKLNKTRKGKR